MITIQALSLLNLQDIDQCDGAFTIDARLELSIEDSRLLYTLVSVPPYQKEYPLDQLDYTVYIDNPTKAIFLAYLDGRIAGQLRLARHWNRFANLEDLVVDRPFRQRGVARALIERAAAWAREKQLAGLVLETQTNNLPAIRLYESCGFELGGFDRHLYHGLNPHSDEIALYWYLIS